MIHCDLQRNPNKPFPPLIILFYKNILSQPQNETGTVREPATVVILNKHGQNTS